MVSVLPWPPAPYVVSSPIHAWELAPSPPWSSNLSAWENSHSGAGAIGAVIYATTMWFKKTCGIWPIMSVVPGCPWSTSTVPGLPWLSLICTWAFKSKKNTKKKTRTRTMQWQPDTKLWMRYKKRKLINLVFLYIGISGKKISMEINKILSDHQWKRTNVQEFFNINTLWCFISTTCIC